MVKNRDSRTGKRWLANGFESTGEKVDTIIAGRIGAMSDGRQRK